jgi:hypothetical protein
MGTTSDQYKLVIEGKLSESLFLRNTRLTFPQFITNVNSYNDTVKILKNKGIINEIKDEKTNEYNPQQYDLGMRYESSKGTDKVKADKIIKKNLTANNAYYTNLHLAGYDEKAMKTNNKKRTDLSMEVKKDNFVDKANGFKTVKADKLTESELRILINKVLTESLEGSSKSISIKNLTYEKAAKIAGMSKFDIQTGGGESRPARNVDDFNKIKKDILSRYGDNITFTFKASLVKGFPGVFNFTDKSITNKGDAARMSFNDTLGKYKD